MREELHQAADNWKRIAVLSTFRMMPSSVNSLTYLRHEIMKGVFPGPKKARLVIRGKTSPVCMARSEIDPIFLRWRHNWLAKHL